MRDHIFIFLVRVRKDEVLFSLICLKSDVKKQIFNRPLTVTEEEELHQDDQLPYLHDGDVLF